MEQERSPAIHGWLGHFIDPALECQFRESMLPQQRRRGLAVAAAISAICCLHLISQIPRFVHHFDQLELVFWLRATDLAASLAAALFMYRSQSQPWMEQVQTLYGLVLVAVSFGMMAYNPSDAALAAAGIVAMVSGIYFFAPLAVWRVVLLGAAMSVSGWFACAVVREQSADDALRLAVWLLVINGIGWFGALTLNRTMRQWFWEKQLLAAACERERKAFDRHKEFAQLISHEFRNPLAVVKSKAQLMKLITDMGAPPEPTALTAIECAADRLNTMLTQWLQSDSYAESLFTPVSRRVSLADLFARVQAATLGSERHPMVFVPPSDDLVVIADADLLAIAMANILDNAVKYSPKGGEILIQARARLTNVVIDISDKGKGIPKDLSNFIFEKYYRESHDGGVKGFGLGLYIVRKIIDIHSGEITFSEAPGGGTIFSISLPASQ